MSYAELHPVSQGVFFFSMICYGKENQNDQQGFLTLLYIVEIVFEMLNTSQA